MKEMLLKDVKVGQGFYVKETRMYYNRVCLSDYFMDSLEWGYFVPVVGGKWEVSLMGEDTTVLIED